MKNVEVDAIDKVIKNAIEVMESSKYQIFEICESARSELTALHKELQRVIEEAHTTIDDVDRLEMKYKQARIRLAQVSRNFYDFQESDIRTAYETATKLQMDLSNLSEKEQHLKARRDELQQRIRNVGRTIERAESLASQMNVVLEYLSGDLNQVTRILESAKTRQLLGLKIIVAQEEERKRIAREVHDGPAQSLANLVLRTEIAERLLGKNDFEAVRKELAELKGQVRSALEEVRKVIFNLRPMALDDLGLIPILRKYVQDFEAKTKIRSAYETIGKVQRLPSAMEVAIYRLVQEAFTNVAKHANATYLTLTLTLEEESIAIVIQDNGLGFNVQRLRMSSAEGAGSHFGLLGMRERVELLEGKFAVESEVGSGTKITMFIPIKTGGG